MKVARPKRFNYIFFKHFIYQKLSTFGFSFLTSFLYIYLYISMKVSVLLPGNSANTVCLTSEKGKVARQQQVVRQAGVRGNLQLLCNWSKAARTGNYKRKPLPQKSCGNKIPVPQSLYWRPSADQKSRGLWVRDWG